jgi:hypothetical protein
VLNSSGDGLPPGVGETAPGRDSQVCQSSGAALWRQSIECPYARAGTGARGCPRAERTPPEGVLSPRARRTSFEGRGRAFERGRPNPRGRRGLERGGPRPRERLSLERGGLHSRGVRYDVLAGRRGHQGRVCAVHVF